MYIPIPVEIVFDGMLESERRMTWYQFCGKNTYDIEKTKKN